MAGARETGVRDTSGGRWLPDQSRPAPSSSAHQKIHTYVKFISLNATNKSTTGSEYQPGFRLSDGTDNCAGIMGQGGVLMAVWDTEVRCNRSPTKPLTIGAYGIAVASAEARYALFPQEFGFDACPARLLLDFYLSGSTALSNSDSLGRSGPHRVRRNSARCMTRYIRRPG